MARIKTAEKKTISLLLHGVRWDAVTTKQRQRRLMSPETSVPALGTTGVNWCPEPPPSLMTFRTWQIFYLLALTVATNLQVPPPKKKSSIDNDFCIFVIYRKDKKRQNFAWRRSLTAAVRDKMGWPLASSDLHCLFSLWFSPSLPCSPVHQKPSLRKERREINTVLFFAKNERWRISKDCLVNLSQITALATRSK